MRSGRIVCLIAASGLTLAAQPLPADPAGMIRSSVHTLDSGKRPAALQLLGAARTSYAVRTPGRAYDLKVSFTVDSGGQTKYDGAWQMEDQFDPAQGLHWTATGPGGYSITRISSHGNVYGQETDPYVPLRLHEARAALLDPMPAAGYMKTAALRESTVNFNGRQLTCYLITPAGKTENKAPGRRWDETDECIDPQSGLLMVHSQVPGRYYTYDYTDAPRLASHLLPRKVTVTEAGRVVMEISVDSLQELPSVDPGLFVPTSEMKAAGRPIAMGPAQKFFRIAGTAPVASTVCVFGVLTPSGELQEAHSLQPNDPNSPAALEEARRLTLSGVTPLGGPPQQHFVFIVERFRH